MKTLELVRSKQRLDYLFEQTRLLPAIPEVRAEWSRYLCVRASGFIEISVQNIFGQYADKRSQPAVANYVKRRLERFYVPKMNDILDLAQLFDAELRESIANDTDEAMKAAIDSIIANRNKIAHGEDVGISHSTLEDYYRRAVKVIEVLENHCT